MEPERFHWLGIVIPTSFLRYRMISVGNILSLLTYLAVGKPAEGPRVLGPVTPSHSLLRHVIDLHLLRGFIQLSTGAL